MEHPEKTEPVEEDVSLGETLARVYLIVLKRRWVILPTACAVTLVAIAVLLQLPNRYQSEATLLVVQQQVPERYVFPTTSTTIADALQGMTKEVLSRRRLLGIIDELGLYREEKESRAPEEVVQLMTRDIEIQPLDASKRREDFNAFRIAFTGEDPIIVQKVTSTLTSLFIQENLRTREEQATTTTKFLSEQLDLKRKQLLEQEQRLREFKMQFLGELPEQQQGNLAILTGLQNQLQNTMTNIGRAQQQRVYLETLLSSHASAASGTILIGQAQPGLPGRVGSNAYPADSLESEIVRLKAENAALLSRYTPGHPDVEKTTREIAHKEAELAMLKRAEEKGTRTAGATPAEGPAPGTSFRSPTRAEALGEHAAVAQLQSQLEANRLELENLTRDEANLKEAVALYQNRLNMTPVREQGLTSILRETEALRQDYADLQKKEQQSQLATDLETNQRGQQFRLVDAPSFPTVPVSPKRLKLSAGAAAGGVALGLLWAFLLEVGHRSFHSEKEMRKHFMPHPPLIVAMPVLFTPREERRRKWRIAAEWCAGTVLVALVGMAEFYVFRFG